MAEKSVTDMILEKFVQDITRDALFKDISDELVALLKKQAGKDNIKALLERTSSENTEP